MVDSQVLHVVALNCHFRFIFVKRVVLIHNSKHLSDILLLLVYICNSIDFFLAQNGYTGCFFFVPCPIQFDLTLLF